MGPISTGLGEIYQYELKAAPGPEGNQYDATDLRTIQDWSVRRQLLSVPGVTEVNSFGGLEKQYQVRLDPTKLQSYGLTLRDVLEAVARNNANVGGAYIEHGAEQYLLRGIGLAESSRDIANIIRARRRYGERRHPLREEMVSPGPRRGDGQSQAGARGRGGAGGDKRRHFPVPRLGVHPASR